MKKTILALTLVVAVAIALAVTIPAFATEDANQTTVTGQIAGAIEVSAPADFSMTLVPGTPTTSALKAVTVNCNEAGWSLTAQASKMYSPTTLVSLGQPLTIAVGTSTSYTSLVTPVTIVASSTTLSPSSTIGTGLFTAGVTFQQTAQWDDPAANDYTTVVTFAGTP